MPPTGAMQSLLTPLAPVKSPENRKNRDFLTLFFATSKRINRFSEVQLMKEWYHHMGLTRAATPGWPSLELLTWQTHQLSHQKIQTS